MRKIDNSPVSAPLKFSPLSGPWSDKAKAKAALLSHSLSERDFPPSPRLLRVFVVRATLCEDNSLRQCLSIQKTVRTRLHVSRFETACPLSKSKQTINRGQPYCTRFVSNQGIRIIMGGLFRRSLLNSITTAGELAQDGEGSICCLFSCPLCHGWDKNRAFCHEMLLENLHHRKKMSRRLCNWAQVSDHPFLAIFFTFIFSIEYQKFVQLTNEPNQPGAICITSLKGKNENLEENKPGYWKCTCEDIN